MKQNKDFDGNKLPTVYDSTAPMTVGKLKEILEKYDDNAIVYSEPLNASNKNDTTWSSTFHGYYPCRKCMEKETKALMLVGSLR